MSYLVLHTFGGKRDNFSFKFEQKKHSDILQKVLREAFIGYFTGGVKIFPIYITKGERKLRVKKVCSLDFEVKYSDILQKVLREGFIDCFWDFKNFSPIYN